MADEVHKGLEGVLVDESKISNIDGDRGILTIRGYSIHDLAQNSTFEETAFLLLNGRLPNAQEFNAFKKYLQSNRSLPPQVLKMMQSYEKSDVSIDALRTTVSLLYHYDPEKDDESPEANIRKARRLIAKFPTIVAAHQRIKQGKKPIAPKASLGHAENFLYMMGYKKPSKLEARAIDLDFLLTAEHSFNASTFSCRVTASTLADVYSAVTSALATLKGPLHGGARGGTMEQMKRIGRPGNVNEFVKETLEKHGKVMGFGHRIYKTFDPRAVEFKKMALALSAEKKNLKWYDLNDLLEERLLKEPKFIERKLYPNVDYYPPIIYMLMGFKPDLGDGMFAIGRIAGWTAHFLEQRTDNKLIRPVALYTGPAGLKYVPMNQRK